MDRDLKQEDLKDYLEERADQLLDAALRLSEVEVDHIYRAARPNQDPTEHVFALAESSAALYTAESRTRPVHLQAALAGTAQLKLPLDTKPSPPPVEPRVLLIDHDADRLIARRNLFVHRKIETEITTSVWDGLDRLETGTFRLVIMDYLATTEEDKSILGRIQTFNLRIPVINVCAWTSVLRADNRLLNRDLLRVASRLCLAIVPDRLTTKPAKRAEFAAQNLPLFGAG